MKWLTQHHTVNGGRHQDQRLGVHGAFAVRVVRATMWTPRHRRLGAVLGAGATLILGDRYDDVFLHIRMLRNKTRICIKTKHNLEFFSL